MNPSAWSALLQAMEDETLGAAKPLPTEIPVKEPSGEVAPLVEPAPVAAPSEPAAPSAPPPAAPAERPSMRNLAQQYGIDMNDVQPTPRTANPSRLTSDLSRASSTLGAAIAGVKPDTSYADTLEKRGASDAAATDKSNDDLTNFKRQLMLRVASDRAAKPGTGPLDPTSAEYLAAVAHIEGNDRMKAVWDRIVAKSKEYGVVPDPYRLAKDFKLGTAEGHNQSEENSIRTQTGANTRQVKGQGFIREMDAVNHGQTVALRGLDNELKKISQANNADHPFRDFAGDVIPDVESAKLVRRNDALAAQMEFLAKKLITEIKTNDALDQKNPLSNRVIAETYQELLNIARDKENFGVPSGKDMEQLALMVADPRSWMEFFTDQGTASLESLIANTRARGEAFAQTNHFGPYGQKNGKAASPNFTPPGAPAAPTTAPLSPREAVKKALLRAQEAGTALTGATEVAPDAKIKVQDENGKTGRIPAAAVEAWLKKNPARKALE